MGLSSLATRGRVYRPDRSSIWPVAGGSGASALQQANRSTQPPTCSLSAQSVGSVAVSVNHSGHQQKPPKQPALSR